jgi:putative hydrolase of the HAD superfamily
MRSDIAVGFDLDHTLGLDHHLEHTVVLEMLAKIATERGVAYDAAAAARALDETLAAYRAGKESVEAGIAGFLLRFVPDLGRAAVDEAQTFRDKVVERVPEFVTALPQAQDMLAALDARGVRYAILTNGWSPLQEEKARALGFRGPVFVSERIGARKPAAAAFATLVRHFELPPEQVWYVGDDPEPDVEGARAAGLTAIWFDWEERVYPQGIAPPGHTIRALGEIVTLLQERVADVANTPE